ncbi:uncharacterized protein LOC144902765 [Branchiostoma floridae x Branchiostoma belcheri]
MGVLGGAGERQRRRALGVLGLVVCMSTVVAGVVDVTIVSKYQFFDGSGDTWLYCYHAGSINNQRGYPFGVEVNTGSGTGFTTERGSGGVTGAKSVRILDTAGDERVGAFSCLVSDGSQTEKAITFKMKSQADVWPVAFTVTASLGDPVTLQMVQKSSRNGTLEWRKGGVGGTVLPGQNGLSLTIASVQSSDEGIYECYYQGDIDTKQGIMRLIVRGCAKNKWGPSSCTTDCPVCYNGGVCDDNTGECVCPPGFHGQNCESACANNKIGTSCTRECDGGDCTGQLLCVMDPYGCSCAPGLMGIECNTVCPDGMYGAGCTQTCHCANGPAACDKETGACTGGCLDFWTGDSCQIVTVLYEHLFTKEEGHFFGNSPEHITTYDDIDAEECARRCLQGYDGYDGVTPTCLSFNHRPAGSPEGGFARCWLRSSDKNTSASPGPEWDSWPHRNYYQRKHLLAPQHCTDIFALGIRYSGVYNVSHPQLFQTYCDMDTDGGGWTVIQRRQDGSVPFDKTWTEYEQGFGNPSGEYWLGLANIHSLTTQKQNELYVYLEDWETNSRFAQYSTFSVGNVSSKYTATIDGYSRDSSVTDSLDPSTIRHSINNRQFSTTDQDNDPRADNCAVKYGQGGWWYTESCGLALLNGQYLTGCSLPAPGTCQSADGIVWHTWLGYYYSLKKAVMMIRPADFPATAIETCQTNRTLTLGPHDSGLYVCTCPPGWNGPFCEQACMQGEFGPDCIGTCRCASGDSVCDIRTGVCSSGGCEAGWKGSNCQTACSPGKFGSNCGFTCRCASGSSVCDIQTGVCSGGGCEAGWKGNDCQTVCTAGEFGPDCNGTCHCASGGSVCDNRTGVCSSGGCEAGWKGFNCQTVCTAGEFGPDCTGICHCASGDSVCDIRTGVCSSGGCEAGWKGNNCQTVCSPGEFGPGCTGTCRCASGDSVCDIRTGVCSSGGCEAGWKGDDCQTACPPGEFGPDCTGTCHCASGPSVCDIQTGVCSSGGCEAGWKGSNCQTVCSSGEFGPGCTGTCRCASGDSVCDIQTGVCSSGGCEAGWKGSNCQTECADGMYGPDCTQTCHCADGPAACDKDTGACAGVCVDFWTGDSCEIRTVTVSYEHLFIKEEGHFFGDSPDNIAAYNNIDAEECAHRCLQGYGSYDGVNPTCLSFNHRPAGSPEGGSTAPARCWLSSSDKNTSASPGPEWDSWLYRNYYQRKHILAPQDCTDMFALGIQYSHVYFISSPQPFQTYCDMDTDGGGWTVIQRRQDGSVPFNKTWTEYEQGFGNLLGEYWLGLGNIHSLATPLQKQNKLYVYLEDWEKNSGFARYSRFSVGDASSKYTATVTGYDSTSTAGNDLDPSKESQKIKNVKFSTIDEDNDINGAHCTALYGQGGWWNPYSCGYAMLNGQYLTGCSVPAPGSCTHANGIVWHSWRGYRYSLKKSVMMIRPTDFPVSSLKDCQNGTLTSGPEDSGLYICACTNGSYGAFCDEDCGHCYLAQTCDKFDGACPTGGPHVCAAGYNGTNCDQECADGYYGHDCVERCGNCVAGTVCEKTDGRCQGCDDPWVGDICKTIPATVSDDPDSSTVVVDDEVTFSCAGLGVPAPTVTWHHSAEVITPGAGISVDVTDGGLMREQHVTHSTLTITSARRQDNGQYVCITSNVAGNSTSQAATLVVQERPDDVTVNVTAENSTALQVTWAVGVTGNLDIIDSQVRYKRSGAEDWTDWASTGVSDVNGKVYIYGLRPAVEYDVQVRANNSLGWSTPGNAIGTTDDAPPSAPYNLQASPASHNSVNLTWEPPIEPNGEITNYTVQYGPSESCSEAEFTHQVTTSDGSTTTVIGDLVPYTNYTFRVRGATSAGGGDFSNCSITRTLEYYPAAPVVQTFADQHDCNCRTPNIPRPVQLRVAWRRPDHIHGQLQAYRISLYNRTGGEPFYQENMTSGLQQENLTAVVTSSHLQPANNYSVTVSAINTFYHGNESHPYMARTSDGCPDAPNVTRLANSECGVTWTPPTVTKGGLTGYNVIYVDKPLQNSDESEPRISYTPLSLDEQQWFKSLAELPANSLVTVTVRAKTCAEGDKGTEFTCEVLRVEPPPRPVLPTGPPPNANSTTSFLMVLPKVSERNGPVRCCQIIVITMTKTETLDDLKIRVGEPDVMLTEEAPDGGKTEPYVALSLSTEEYKRTDVVEIGDGAPCGDKWCCDRSELADSSRAKTHGNKKLQSGSKYTAAVRCYVNSGAKRRKRNTDTEKLFTTSGYIDPVETVVEVVENVFAPMVAGVAVGVCLVGLVAVSLYFYRRRAARKKDAPADVSLADLSRIRKKGKDAEDEGDELEGAVGPGADHVEEVIVKPKRRSGKKTKSQTPNFQEPIALPDLEAEFDRRTANDNQIFSEEYSALPGTLGKEHAEAYYSDFNTAKNRFKNIITYDSGRVKLNPIPGVDGSDYISASYMDGYRVPQKYIAAQGPMPNTVDDFWRMIWDTKAKNIVMVTNLKENNKQKCTQYWPDSGKKAYGDIDVTLVDTIPMVDHVTRIFLVGKSGVRGNRQVTQFHFLGWPDYGLPKSPMGLLKFRRAVVTKAAPKDIPIVVHCSAGVGRTGTLLTVDAMLEMMQAEEKVDVFGFVSRMRQNRSTMVQTKAQYVFIYRALLEQYLYGDTEVEVANIHHYMHKLRTEQPGKDKTGFEIEFGNLTRLPVDRANMRGGNLPENISKNRVLQILPYDTNRVFLQHKPGVKGSDYINASFIDGYREKDVYIATQGPLAQTVEDFWRMVWEWNSCSIVMLTELKEKGRNECSLYWPETGQTTFGEVVVSAQGVDTFGDYDLRTFTVTHAKQEGKPRTVQQFHFHGWPEVGSPDNASGMIDLIGQVQKQQQQSGNGPITVHCSTGSGRTGTFCAISTVLERVKAEGICDVFQVVKALRLQRPHMVQTLDQYQFCYQAVLEYLDSFDHYANFR